jgi:glycosyltransferase involved in cell wall biosynthesis
MPPGNDSKPSISVLMPVWNSEAFVGDAVRSILAQSHKDFEFLVVDGGSTDNTLASIRAFGDNRIRILHAFPGIVAALNLGLQEARGNWIARQDADDISHPNRLQAQLAAVERRKDVVLCYTNDELFGELPRRYRRAKFTRTQALLALRLCFQCPVVHSSVLFSKKAVDECGRYRGQQGEDYDLWGRLLQTGKTLGLSKRLVMTRRHSDSASQRHSDHLALVSNEIALRHCREFMRLSEADALRAYAALALHGAKKGLPEWRWFVTTCLPRLRWKSAELYAWVFWQTLKALL